MLSRTNSACHAGFMRETNLSGIFMLGGALPAMRDSIRCDLAGIPRTKMDYFLKKKVLARDQKCDRKKALLNIPFRLQ